MRGDKKQEHSGELWRQKERLEEWLVRTRNKVIKEEKDVILGGDLNAHIWQGEGGDETDNMGRRLVEELTGEAGLEMVVKEITHQEVRRGVLCKGRCIDHMFTNIPYRQGKVNVEQIAGSHHSLVYSAFTKAVVRKGPGQRRVRVRKTYTKEGYLAELDKKD